MAFPIAFTPLTVGTEDGEETPRSCGRVMRKIFRRSNGAVQVLETSECSIVQLRDGQ